jgi:hypothetical protein
VDVWLALCEFVALQCAWGGLNLVDLNPPRSRCHILFDLIMDKSLDWCFSLSVHLPSRFKADVSSATNYLGIFIGTFGV